MSDLSDQPLRCKVKWYNTAKGFGFVVPAEGPEQDWFLHATVLQKAGVTALGEGAIVTCEIGEGMKGLCVKKVLEIHDYGQMTDAGAAPRQHDGYRDNFRDNGRDNYRDGGYPPRARDNNRDRDGGSEVLEEVTGTVKWYDTVKEFGFITPDDGMKDIFVHKSCVERAGLSVLEPGQKLRIKSRNVPKGREAKEIIAFL